MVLTGTKQVCRSCEATDISVFYEVGGVPAHSVLLMPSMEAAKTYPRGDIALASCPRCGFVGNAAFDPTLLEYSPRYEETQGYSATFNAFAQRLAALLVSRYGLRKKTIVEIGCGKGEFLASLCTLGENYGIGFDPGYVAGRLDPALTENITFIQDFYSEEYADMRADFVCCRMTLEHIDDVEEFVRTIARSIGDNRETIVFIQVPNAARVFQDLAFWDIYYEHCSYFTDGSLSDLFRRGGFDVVDRWRDYDDQYLMLAAVRARRPATSDAQRPDYLQRATEDVRYFRENHQKKIVSWRNLLTEFRAAGQRTVIWGSGSKGVAFLTTLGVGGEIEYVVDINPHRQGTYLAGTGHEIVSPTFLLDYQPDNVIVMNPVYREEIRQSLERMGLAPQIIAV